jgi:hypothetical protein
VANQFLWVIAKTAKAASALSIAFPLSGFDGSTPYVMDDSAGRRITCPAWDLDCLAICHSGGFTGHDPEEAAYVEHIIQNPRSDQYKIILGQQTPEQEKELAEKIRRLDHDYCLTVFGGTASPRQ